MEPNEKRELLVLLYTDVVDSVQWQNRLGMEAWVASMGRHNALLEECVGGGLGGRLVNHTGDGFLAGFHAPSDAIRAALQFQYRMSRGPERFPFQVRVGLDQGELVQVTQPDGNVLVYGKPAHGAARIMGLAGGGQILMTAPVFDDARRFVTRHPDVPGTGPEALPEILWLAHGLYFFKGEEKPVDIFEVGAQGIAPLKGPPNSEKAWKADSRLGQWQPEPGAEIPNRKGWRLVEPLGRGSYGEVWLAQKESASSARAFKFCFDEQRLSAFRREAALCRILTERLGFRDDIAAVHDAQVDTPPYYLESEYSPHGSLLDWASRHAPLSNVPLPARIELMTRIARAVGAAHSAGVIHKDIKPSNILVREDPDGTARPRITDFGIGFVADPSLLQGATFRAEACSRPSSAEVESYSRGLEGSLPYIPPEYVGENPPPPSVQGDVYALGVLLYQLLVGDLRRLLAAGWERDVTDPLLREDIRLCVDKDPERRLTNAQALAERLETLEERREEAAEEEARREATRRSEERARQAVQRSHRLRLALLVSMAAGALVTAAGFAFWRQSRDLARSNDALESSNAARALELAGNGLALGNPDYTLEGLLQIPPLRRSQLWRLLLGQLPPSLSFERKHLAERFPFIGDGKTAFSEDGRWFAFAREEAVIVIDRRTGEQIRRLPFDGQLVQCLAFRPGGSQLFVCAGAADASEGSPQHPTQAWLIHTGNGNRTPLALEQLPPFPRAAGFNESGSRLILIPFSGSNPNDPEGLRAVSIHELPQSAAAGPRLVAHIPFVPNRNADFRPSVALSPRGKYLALAEAAPAGDRDFPRQVTIRDTADGTLIGSVPGIGPDLNDLQFSDNEEWLVISPSNGPALLHEIAGARSLPLNPPQTSKGSGPLAAAVRLPPGDAPPELWETAGEGSLAVRRMHEPEVRWQAHRSAIHHGALQPRSQGIFLAGSLDQRWSFWSTADRSLLFSLRWQGNPLPYQRPLFTGDGEDACVAVGADQLLLLQSPQPLSLTLAEGTILPLPDRPKRSAMFAQSFSRDGRLLAMGFAGGRVAVFSLDPVGEIKLPQALPLTGEITVCQFSSDPGSKYLFLADRSGAYCIVKTKGWIPGPRQEAPLQDGRGDSISRVFFSPDLQRLAAVYTNWKDAASSVVQPPPGADLFSLRETQDGHLELFDPVHVPGGAGQFELNAALSPDGRLLATAFHGQAPGDQTPATAETGSFVAVWDLQAKRHLLDLQGHTFPLRAYDFSDLAFSGDSRRLVAAANSGEGESARAAAVVWQIDPDAPSAERVGKMEGQQGRLTHLRLSGDGRRVLAADSTGEVRWMDTVSGSSPRIGGHGRAVFKADLQPGDEAVAASLSTGDRSFRLWDLAAAAEVIRIPLTDLPGHEFTGFSPDGRSWLVPGWKEKAELWQIPSPENRPTLAALHAALDSRTREASSPTTGYTATVQNSSEVMLRHQDSGQSRSLPLFSSPVVDLRFTPDGSGLIVLTEAGQATLWHVEQRIPVMTLFEEGCLLAHFLPGDAGLITLARQPDSAWVEGTPQASAQAIRLVARRWPLAPPALASSPLLGNELRRLRWRDRPDPPEDPLAELRTLLESAFAAP